jgi:hypothetical protein
MDETSTVASNKSSGRDGKKSMVYAQTEDSIEIEEEIPVEFSMDDDVGPTVEDDLVVTPPAERPPSLLHANSFKGTKSSGDVPPYNRWLELIDQLSGKAPLQLSDVSRAGLNKVFPVIYCTDPENHFDNDHYWEPCILKKIGREWYEVLDAN